MGRPAAKKSNIQILVPSLDGASDSCLKAFPASLPRTGFKKYTGLEPKVRILKKGTGCVAVSRAPQQLEHDCGSIVIPTATAQRRSPNDEAGKRKQGRARTGDYRIHTGRPIPVSLSPPQRTTFPRTWAVPTTRRPTHVKCQLTF